MKFHLTLDFILCKEGEYMTVQLKRNDTKDTISYTLTNLDGSVVNLTGATVRFVMGKNKTLITNAAATIVNATTGQVSYTLTDADTLVAGNFNAEFEVTFSTGKVKTYPSDGYILVKIQANMDIDQSTYIEDQIAYRVSDIQVLKNSIQAQLDEFAKGATNEETAQARVEADGTTNTTLKARLDKKEAKFTQDIQTLSTSVAQKMTQDSIDVPYKLKPTKEKINHLLAGGQWEYVKSEDFGYPKGTFLASSELNAKGGTDGTTRFMIMLFVKIKAGTNIFRWKRTGNQAAFSLSLHETDFKTRTSVLGSSSTDLGGGVYSTQYTFDATHEGKYARLQWEFSPTNTANDTTLHTEYAVIEYLEREISGVIDTTKGSDWQNTAIVNNLWSINPQTLWQVNDNFYYLATNSVVGRKPRYLYASPTASKIFGTAYDYKLDVYSYGTKERPLEFTEAMKLDMCETIILLPGTYTWTNKAAFLKIAVEQNLANYEYKNIKHLLCLDGEAVFIGHLSIPTSSMTLHSGTTYSMPFSSTSYNTDFNFTPAKIAVYSDEEGTRPYHTVATLAECTAKQGTCYYSSGTLYVNFWNGVQITLYTPNSTNFFRNTAVDVESIIYNVTAKGFYECFFTSKPFFFYNTKAIGSTREAFNIDDTHGIFVNCEGRKAGNDGFNFDHFGHTELYDCIAKDNFDDGCSHHNECTFHMQGGEYSNNGKGGVTPAYNVKGICIDVLAKNNKGGSNRVGVGDERYGAFFVFGLTTSDYKTQLKCYRCTADGNYRGFLAAEATAVIETYECKSLNNQYGISAINGAVMNEYRNKYTGNTTNKQTI
jgi:hypothetical protein